MRHARVHVWSRFAATVVVGLGVTGCGSGGVTVTRIEAALAPTFANLISLQEARLGLAQIDARSIKASAQCRRVAPGQERGAGVWKCTVHWSVPGRSLLQDAYDLSVTADGCYTASVDGATMGGPLLQGRDGHAVVNLLYAFDGCFDPDS